MSNRTLAVNDHLYDYLLEHSVRESQTLADLREATKALPDARMQIAPEQGQFMALLVQLTGARRIVEIGTFTGYSTLCMARALGDDGRIVACDLSTEWTGMGAEYWKRAGVLDRIDLRIGPALNTLEGLLDNGEAGQYDMAFVDADKENNLNYYELCLQLVRPGGLIMFDNTLWNGDVANPDIQDEATQAIRDLNDRLLQDERISLSLVPIGDGLSLAYKRGA